MRLVEQSEIKFIERGTFQALKKSKRLKDEAPKMIDQK